MKGEEMVPVAVLLYQILDRVSGVVLGPIVTFRHDGPAVRWFYDVLQDERSELRMHPLDYEFLCLGHQGISGEIDGLDIPRVVATGAGWAAMNSPRVVGDEEVKHA